MSDDAGASESGRRGGSVVITDARTPASKEMSSRVRRYTITMAFRTACFLSMIFVHGWIRWVLFACAVVLPYIAVVLANQANQRGQTATSVDRGEPGDHLAITTGDDAEVVSGHVVDDEHHEDRRVA